MKQHPHKNLGRYLHKSKAAPVKTSKAKVARVAAAIARATAKPKGRSSYGR
jgi:hypothetical protein